MKPVVRVEICMGSSCFARGNNENLEFLEKNQENSDFDIKLELIGKRCENICSEGPHICINEKKYNKISTDDLKNILENRLWEN